MNSIITGLQGLQAKLLDLLQGEPVRVIIYGSAVVVFLVGHIGNALGFANLPEVSFDTAVGEATIVAGALGEFIRRFVFSPSTVQQLVAEASAEVTPVAPPPAQGPAQP